MRLFKTEKQPGGKTVQWFSQPDGTVIRKVVQESQGIVDAVKASSDQGARGKNMYHVGSIPETLAIDWLREMGPGYTLYSREFAQYAKKKLQSAEFSKLATGVT